MKTNNIIVLLVCFQIINILGSKKGKRGSKDRRLEKLNRRISGSVSSLTASIASRDPCYNKSYRFYSRKDDIDSSKGSVCFLSTTCCLNPKCVFDLVTF